MLRVSRRSQHRPRRDFLYPLTSHFPSCTNHILFPLLHFPSIPKHTHSPLFHFHSGANHTLSPPSCFLSVANYILSPPPHTTISTLHNIWLVFLRVKGILIFNRLQRREISLTKTKNLRLQRVILHGRRFFLLSDMFYVRRRLWHKRNQRPIVPRITCYYACFCAGKAYSFFFNHALTGSS